MNIHMLDMSSYFMEKLLEKLSKMPCVMAMTAVLRIMFLHINLILV